MSGQGGSQEHRGSPRPRRRSARGDDPGAARQRRDARPPARQEEERRGVRDDDDEDPGRMGAGPADRRPRSAGRRRWPAASRTARGGEVRRRDDGRRRAVGASRCGRVARRTRAADAAPPRGRGPRDPASCAQRDAWERPGATRGRASARSRRARPSAAARSPGRRRSFSAMTSSSACEPARRSATDSSTVSVKNSASAVCWKTSICASLNFDGFRSRRLFSAVAYACARSLVMVSWVPLGGLVPLVGRCTRDLQSTAVSNIRPRRRVRPGDGPTTRVTQSAAEARLAVPPVGESLLAAGLIDEATLPGRSSARRRSASASSTSS